ncbi:hypothetical protein MNB_SV-13-1970 [hydrothermal vent metagenome]|uniref:Uncharacterized protein n=1 Tax=hydrothermal vent metagenome TaxID=652676 RepID=A0A1W1CWX7_9ZZZZ
MDLKNSIGLGVAGNFAHHLEQAGELKDFESVITKEQNAPKGIFPFYLPHSKTFLGLYPISDTITLPPYQANTQVEPEIVILFDIVYNNAHEVSELNAKCFSTFNDCTIRKEGAKKISEKKSWGKDSKGLGDKWIAIDKFERGGLMDDYHLCSFVKREGILYPYGEDAPLLGYSYFYKKLEIWLIDKMNSQEDFGPLENIAQDLKDAQYPKQALISIGATAYLDFGENNYLKEDDEIYVIAYNPQIDKGDIAPSSTKIILKQKVKS